MIVNKQEYYYKKLLKSTNDNINKTIEIDDKEAILLGLESQEELSVNIISIEWENTNNIETYEGIKPTLPNILIHWDDDTTTSIKASNNKVVLSDISYYKTQGTYILYASFNNFTTTNSINVNVIKDELISIEWSVKTDISTQQNNKANLPYIQLNYISGKINNIAYNTSSVILNNIEYYKTIGNYELYATYKGFTTDILNVYVTEIPEQPIYDEDDPHTIELNFTAIEEDGSIVTVIKNYFQNIEYSYNRNKWYSYPGGNQKIFISYNSTLYLRGNRRVVSSENTPVFSISGKVNISGNILSILTYYTDNNIKWYNYNTKEPLRCDSLFVNCDIVSAKNLILSSNYTFICRYMFDGCTLLVNAPELPATTLWEHCYYNMFRGCTSLVNAPELPATTLVPYCYEAMFSECTSLVNAPELPATTLAYRCYDSMFYNTNIIPDCSNIDFYSETVINSGALFGLFAGTKITDNDLYNILPINEDNKYYLPIVNFNLSYGPEDYYGATNIGIYHKMFKDCVNLITAPELPNINLSDGCYSSMFEGCTSLIIAPELPAISLSNGCYKKMFSGCTSLVNAPELPATTLASYCYESMFSGCTSLVNAPELHTTELAKDCYSMMFMGCTSLVNAPELPATTLAPYCYRYMFDHCTSLVKGPDLLALELQQGCYDGMFKYCINLNEIKMLFTVDENIIKNNELNYPDDNWGLFNDDPLQDVASIGIFIKNKDAVWPDRKCVPSGWTVILE